ncbi:FAD-binding oxidoreductase [Candidatus Formimonas warabiya]|uniref:FAD-binding PCMH-type domain-containing protein n=1 Tax=Formimonas warabiya TaxID=1761012 RepID=A0A3G1L0G1_FORW1|nr:FAD-binding oxidoreductase [Candidatus Formimonas warabiya]ATW28150.1 hypothetical protein DCMF_28385 [Candidatus Formimonas warabiya]
MLKKLRGVVGEKDVLTKKTDLTAYRDSVHLSGPPPSAVVFPKNTAEVSEVLKILSHYGVPVIARGAGTNLCGDTLSQGVTVILEMAKMDRIWEVNILDRYIAVEPGVSNMAVQKALEPHGYFFAPDPASFGVATIGGNIGENAGGMRCVKYGVTTDNVIGLEMVLSDGQVILSHGPVQAGAGYDLTGLMHGSEGTFGVITKAWLKIIKLPEEVKTLVAVFPTLEDAVTTVSQIMGRGMIPSALEIIDHLAIQALEETMPLGYPLDAEAVLLIEVDGFAGTLDGQVQRIVSICNESKASEIRVAKTEKERQTLWLGRREALNCFVSKRPTYAQEDVAVPRTRLPEMLNIIKQIGGKYALVIASVCHAGDGNFHPTIIYDDHDEEETKRAHLGFSEMMEHAIELGGTITGEHGVGIEKLKGMNLLFSREELSFMWRLKLALDPKKILNPGKVIPENISQMPTERTEQISGTLSEDFRRDQYAQELEIAKIGGIHFDQETRKAYSLNDHQPWCVIRPESVEQIATMVRLAHRYDIKIVPWGKGTKVSLGTYGKPYDVIAELSNLNQVIEIDGENLTATVEAGVELNVFQEMLHQKGYMLPVNPLEKGSPTLGGIVAANSTGSLRLKYGTLKNLVLGLEVVTADGKNIHYGGKMIKNVAGYDVRKLFVGSWGTLGIITKITVKIFPLPGKALHRTYVSENYQAFIDFIFSVQQKDLALTSFDLAVHDQKHYVNLGISGQAESVDRQLKMLNELVNKEVALWEEDEDPDYIPGRAFYDKYIPPDGDNKAVLKSSLRFSDLPGWMEKVLRFRHRGKVSLYGDGASGLLYAAFSGDKKDLADFITEMGADFRKSFVFGTHTLEADPGICIWEGNKPKDFAGLRLKEMLDPKKIFSPDRTLGGLAI